MEHEFRERRRSPRASADNRTMVALQVSVPIRLLDLSSDGLLLACEAPLRVGSTVPGRFQAWRGASAGGRTLRPSRVQPAGRGGWRLRRRRELSAVRPDGPANHQRATRRERALHRRRTGSLGCTRPIKDPDPWRRPARASCSAAGTGSAGTRVLDLTGTVALRQRLRGGAAAAASVYTGDAIVSQARSGL